MKTALIFADGIKQIIFTPENDDERQALKMFTSDDHIELAVVEDGLYDYPNKGQRPYAPSLGKCRGGWLRVFGEDSKSIMFVLSPKKKEENSLT